MKFNRKKILFYGFGIFSKSLFSILKNCEIDIFDKTLILKSKLNSLNRENNEFNILKNIKEKEYDFIFVGTPTRVLFDVKRKLKNFKKSKIILVQKGFLRKNKNLYFPFDIFKDFPNKIFISGPSIAKDILENNFYKLIFSSNNRKLSKELKKIFIRKHKIKINKDYLGCQICSSLKNIYSILYGYYKNEAGFSYGKFLKKCLSEIYEISKTFGEIKKKTLNSYSGKYDLEISFKKGRNSNFGTKLFIKKKVENFPEGYYSFFELKKLLGDEVSKYELLQKLDKIL